MKRCSFAFYNLAPAGDPKRGEDFIQKELGAIANNIHPDPDRRRPKVLGVCEAIHRSLPQLDRFTLIRSTENLSKANVALYVRDDLDHGDPEWVMHERTWPRPLHPAAGRHEPRATLVVEVENWTVVVSHAPQAPQDHWPAETREAVTAARTEWVKIVARLVNRPAPVLLLSDPNGLGDDLRQRVQALEVHGTPIESAALLGARMNKFDTPETVNGIVMMSDHRRCLIGRARLH